MKVIKNNDIIFGQTLSVHDNSYHFMPKLNLIEKKESIYPCSYYNIVFKLD